MARHVKILNQKTFNGNVETDKDDTMAKMIFDVVNGKTVVALTVCPFGRDPIAVIVYDD